MKIKIYWNGEKTQELFTKVKNSLEDLWLSDFMEVDLTQDENLKKELSFSEEPALIIEEEVIDYKDVIFEWIVPEDDEIKAMFVSIIWGWDTWGWCSSGSCGSCSTSWGCW